MYYPAEIIEEIVEKNDIVDIVSSHVTLKKKGAYLFGLCPFHNEKSASFSVSPSRQTFHCFGCHEGGNVISFVMKYENYTFTEAIEYLAQRSGINLPQGDSGKYNSKIADIKNTILKINVEAARYYYHMLINENDKAGIEYFNDRSLSMATIKRFGLGYTGKRGNLYQYLKGKGFSDKDLKESGLFTFDEKGVYDKFWNRVMFPIFDVNDRLIAFGGRVLGDAKPKYLNSPETELFKKSRNMYGLNIARKSRKNYLLICEGYMDVIALVQAGFENAAAALGTSFTPEHASLVKRYFKKVVLTFDSDEAGIKAALRAIPIFTATGINVKVLNLLPYKDPDEFIKNLGSEEYQKRIDEAENFFVFKAKQIAKKYNLNTPDGKTDFYNELAMELTEFSEELERSNYIEAVSREFNIDMDKLGKLVVNKFMSDEKRRRDIEKERMQESVAKKRQPKDDAITSSQKLLLTWISQQPDILPKVSKYISPEDFEGEMYQIIARDVYDMVLNKSLSTAIIISRFTEEEEQSIVANIFNTPLDEAMGEKEKNLAFNELIKNIKLNSIHDKMKNLTDISEYDKYVKLENEIKNLNILL